MGEVNFKVGGLEGSKEWDRRCGVPVLLSSILHGAKEKVCLLLEQCCVLLQGSVHLCCKS